MDYAAQRLWDRLMRHTEQKRGLYAKTLGPCFLYTGPKNHCGYGKISMRLPGRKNPTGVATHRLSFETFVRKVRTGYEVSHKCHNAACWNPKHLCEQTHGTNIRWRDALRRAAAN